MLQAKIMSSFLPYMRKRTYLKVLIISKMVCKEIQGEPWREEVDRKHLIAFNKISEMRISPPNYHWWKTKITHYINKICPLKRYRTKCGMAV